MLIAQVGTVDTWAEVLANGATSGSTNPEVTAGQALKTNTINETSAGSGVTIDSVLLKDDVVNATDVETGSISANDGTAAATIANSTGNFTVTNFISNSVDIGGGAIDGTVIGGASAAAGSFTTIVGTSATIDDITINGSSITDAGNLTFDIGGDLNIDVDGGDINLKDNGAVFGVFSSTNNDLNIRTTATDEDIVFKGSDGGSEITALTLDMSDSGTANFGGAVVLGGSLIKTGDMTLDASGDIILDAAGDDIIFKTGGVEFGSIFYTNSNLYLNSAISNGDMVFRGNDGGSAINALVLDMSDAGTAAFNHNVTLPDAGEIQLGANGDFRFFHDGSNNYIKGATSDQDVIIQGNDGGNIIAALTLDMSDGGEAYFSKNIHATSAFLTTANNDPQLTLISTDADASVGPILKLYRNSASPADGDVLGRIQWSGEDDAGNDSTFARLTVTATDVSNGAETAKMVFAPATSDAFPDALTLTGDGAAFNDDLFVGSTITGYDDITGGAGLAIGDGSDTTAGIMIRTGGTGTGRIYFGDNSGNAAGRKAGRIEYSHSAEEMTVFSTGSLKLDSVTGVLDFDDNGTNIGRFENSSSDFKMESRVQDKDIVFVGNDGGVGINALTLDMSLGGTAIFNDNVGIGQAPTAFSNWRVLELKAGSAGAMINYENSSSAIVAPSILIVSTVTPALAVTVPAKVAF